MEVERLFCIYIIIDIHENHQISLLQEMKSHMNLKICCQDKMRVGFSSNLFI